MLESWFHTVTSVTKILSNFQKEWCTFGRKKGRLKKTRIVHSWGLSALNMQKYFLFASSFEHVNFEINGKYSQKNLWQSKLLCFPCDLSKCNFKDCPLTWVAPLIVILPHSIMSSRSWFFYSPWTPSSKQLTLQLFQQINSSSLNSNLPNYSPNVY
jgi:hypothetical protein